jgi:hypothetical protein
MVRSEVRRWPRVQNLCAWTLRPVPSEPHAALLTLRMGVEYSIATSTGCEDKGAVASAPVEVIDLSHPLGEARSGLQASFSPVPSAWQGVMTNVNKQIPSNAAVDARHPGDRVVSGRAGMRLISPSLPVHLERV